MVYIICIYFKLIKEKLLLIPSTMKCLICNKKIERVDLKIKCVACNNFYHGKCVNMGNKEIDIYEKSGNFKCNTCLNVRRNSVCGNSNQLSSLKSANNYTNALTTTKTSLTPNINAVINSSPSSFTMNNTTASTTTLTSITSNSNTLLNNSKSTNALTNTTTKSSFTPNTNAVINSSSSSFSSTSVAAITNEILYSEIIKLQQFNLDALNRIKYLEEHNITLSKKVLSLEEKVNKLEQKELLNCIDIVNVPDMKKESVKENVKKLLSVGLNENISDDEISSCYIKKVKAKNDTQLNIVCVKFKSRHSKMRIMNKIRKNKSNLNTNILNEKGVGKKIYVNEALTFNNRKLMHQAKILKKNGKCKFVWLKNSVVNLKINYDDKAIQINSVEDLKNIFNLDII